MAELAVTKRNGVERAAILLLTLGESEAAGILKHLGAKDVQKLGRVMAELGGVSRDDVRRVEVPVCLGERGEAREVGDQERHVDLGCCAHRLPLVHVDQRSSPTTRTGPRAPAATAFDTDPRSAARTRPRPRVPTTMRS